MTSLSPSPSATVNPLEQSLLSSDIVEVGDMEDLQQLLRVQHETLRNAVAGKTNRKIILRTDDDAVRKELHKRSDINGVKLRPRLSEVDQRREDHLHQQLVRMHQSIVQDEHKTGNSRKRINVKLTSLAGMTGKSQVAFRQLVERYGERMVIQSENEDVHAYVAHVRSTVEGRRNQETLIDRRSEDKTDEHHVYVDPRNREPATQALQDQDVKIVMGEEDIHPYGTPNPSGKKIVGVGRLPVEITTAADYSRIPTLPLVKQFETEHIPPTPRKEEKEAPIPPSTGVIGKVTSFFKKVGSWLTGTH